MTGGAVLAELLSIYSTHGTLNPDLVLDAARPADSVLHDKFEWDNDAAAEKYRRVQASELIRSVKIQPLDPDAPSEALRAFVSVRSPSEPSNYVPTDTVTDQLTQRVVLAQMKRDVDRMTQRYRHLAEFWTYLSGQQEAS